MTTHLSPMDLKRIGKNAAVLTDWTH